MTVQKMFCEFNDKYGDDFNWYLLPLTNKTFVAELKREIGKDHFLYNKSIQAVAKCDSNDDVLYITNDKTDSDIYYIFHLTYSVYNENGFPKYKKFTNIGAVKDFIEQTFLDNYL